MQPSSLELRSQLSVRNKSRAFLGIVVAVVGIYTCLPFALAEEEDTSQDAGMPDSRMAAISRDTTTKLSIGDLIDEDNYRYISTINNSFDDTEPERLGTKGYAFSHPAFPPSKFDNVLIPETVWSLDASTGAHLDHISGGPGSDIYRVFGGSLRDNGFWFGDILHSLANKNGGASGLLVVPPGFQVASCGGSSAERGDLDYCNKMKLITYLSSDPPKQSASDTATQAASNNALSSSDGPASDLSVQPFTAPSTPNTAPLTPAIGYAYLLPGTILIDPLETPVDAPGPVAPPIDVLAPPIDLPNPEAPPPGPIVYVDGPGPVSDLPPVFTPQPLKPIPEASTWVMTTTGFSIMFFIFRKKRRLRINPISIIDISEIC